MSAAADRSGSTPAERAFDELVRSLGGTLVPSIVMSILFVGVAIIAYRATGDRAIAVLGVVGTVVSAWRLAAALDLRRRLGTVSLDDAAARFHERRFAIPYIGFAIVFGTFAARAMAVAPAEVRAVVTALVVGYGAGVAAGLSLRPRIGLPSMLIGTVPAALAAIAAMDLPGVTLGVVILALLAGGVQSTAGRYRAEIEKIELRLTISGLARLDHLTGLPNRLGLAEAFARATGGGEGRLVAIHCLDLDRFKPVNDCHGHPVGDALLREVAARLSGALRSGDLAARLGGDEFVVFQAGIGHPDEAHLLARRLNRVMSAPYAVAGLALSVGASVGYAIATGGEALEALIARADQALYAVKAAGGGAAAHSDMRIGKAHIAR